MKSNNQCSHTFKLEAEGKKQWKRRRWLLTLCSALSHTSQFCQYQFFSLLQSLSQQQRLCSSDGCEEMFQLNRNRLEHWKKKRTRFCLSKLPKRGYAWLKGGKDSTCAINVQLSTSFKPFPILLSLLFETISKTKKNHYRKRNKKATNQPTISF